VNPDGDDVEATLDAEYASASAPSAAIVMASCGNTQTTFGGFIAIQNVLNESGTPPAIMSISYGECETGNGAASNAAFNAAFQQAVTEGVSVFVSSGDEGAASCNANDPAATYGIGVSGWASTPYNVAVGGTDFGDTYASSTGAYWNSTTNTVANFTGGVTNGSTVVTAPAGTFGACFVGAAISGTDIVPGATIIAVASPTSATMSNSATATDASDPITISSINSAACSSALSYIPEIPWNDSCASGLIAQYLGYPQTYGASGLCGSGQGLTTASGSGGPSGCATGSPSVPGVVGGTCAGTPKPSWQSLVGNAGDGVRDIPDVSLFAANGVWDHYYPFCFSDPSNGGAPCTDTPANWPGAGGTSFSAPIMAGIQALINQNAGGPQGNPNPVYYQLAAAEYGTGGSSSCNSTLGNAAASSCIFYDVTQGDMDVNCLPLSGSESFNCYFDSAVNGVLSTSTSTYQPAFGASTGWDFATGIGTVNAYNLVTNWPVALATTTTVISGQNPAFQGVAVTFTATVSPTGTHAPSGTVTFNDGGSAIGSGTLGASGGSQVATFTTSSLDLGPHSITAVYAGDSYNATSTSAILTETINADPTFNFSSQPTTPAPAAAGTATISTFTVAPTGTGVTTFAANVTLACNGLPDPTVTCSFSTNPIPAGSNATNETLTITTIGPNKAGANNHPRSADNRSPWLPLTLPLAGIVMVGLAGRKISKYSAIAGLCASLLLLGFLLACGKNTPVAISVSPEGATVFANGPSGSTWPPQTATFTATVSNTNNTGVNWTVTTSNGGSIASDGTYTAPIIAAGLPSSATITATSQADSSKTATATVTITPTSVPGTYPLTVTATEGPTQNTSSSFNLTVQ
jgi:subtilase family serine protease